jgi:hypothetical protein
MKMDVQHVIDFRIWAAFGYLGFFFVLELIGETLSKD